MTRVDPQRAEVDPLRAEIDLLRVEVDPLRAEVDLLRVEADRLSAEVDPLRSASVLIIGVHYAPEQLGFAARSSAMARDLAAIAERVVVFTGAPAPAGSRFTRFPGRNRRSTDHEHGVLVVRHRYHRSSRPGALSRAWYERSFLRAALRTPLPYSPDLVIGVLPSVGAAVAAAGIAQRFRVPLLLVVHDAVATLTRDGGLVGSAVAPGQAGALRQAARVVLVGAGLRASVTALGVEKSRIDVLADWPPALPARQEPVTARARIGVTADDLLVLHVGNIGFGQDVPTLIRAARRIAGRAERAERAGRAERSGRAGWADRDRPAGTKNLQVVLVGEGSQREALETASTDLPDVRFLDPVGAGEYPALLAAADVLVVTELPGCPDRTLPSRLESYLRAGRPVVAAINPDGEADRLLRSVPSAAVIVPAGDSGALASVLIRLRDDEGERVRLRDGARACADAALGRPGAGRSIRDVVRSTLTSPVR